MSEIDYEHVEKYFSPGDFEVTEPPDGVEMTSIENLAADAAVEEEIPAENDEVGEEKKKRGRRKREDRGPGTDDGDSSFHPAESMPDSIQNDIEDVQDDRDFELMKWKGLLMWRCRYCPFDTLKGEDVIRAHVRDVHGRS